MPVIGMGYSNTMVSHCMYCRKPAAYCCLVKNVSTIECYSVCACAAGMLPFTMGTISSKEICTSKKKTKRAAKPSPAPMHAASPAHPTTPSAAAAAAVSSTNNEDPRPAALSATIHAQQSLAASEVRLRLACPSSHSNGKLHAGHV